MTEFKFSLNNSNTQQSNGILERLSWKENMYLWMSIQMYAQKNTYSFPSLYNFPAFKVIQAIKFQFEFQLSRDLIHLNQQKLTATSSKFKSYLICTCLIILFTQLLKYTIVFMVCEFFDTWEFILLNIILHNDLEFVGQEANTEKK